MSDPDYPYCECDSCESITDCNNIEIANDGFGTPAVPDDCPKKDKYCPDKKQPKIE